jgi:nucleotide-binding universal stress UspA family protein
MLRFRAILHPTDFSPLSENAFHLACSLARDHGARVIVLHVAVPPMIGPGGGSLTPPPEGDWAALEKQLWQTRPPDPTIPVEHRLELGNPAAEILRVAAERDCDLIVIGSHGRSWLAALLMGGVAAQVVRKARCPVLVVKTPFPERGTSGAPQPAAGPVTASESS